MRTGNAATFKVNFEGDTYTGQYRGLAVIKAAKKTGLKKLAATGFSQLTRNGQVIFSVKEPTDVFIERNDKDVKIILADKTKKLVPMVNKL